MSATDSQPNTSPLAKFSFSLKMGGLEMIFREVSGLTAIKHLMEYQVGYGKDLSTVKMPEMAKFGNVTLKKGIYSGDKTLWDEYNRIKMNTSKREDVVISLLDENNVAAMSWKLGNAFPCKMTLTDMKSDANEVAIETLELAHEGLALV